MSLAVRLMEFEPVVRIYEGPLWRRSPVVGALFGLPFEKELERVLAAIAPAETAIVVDVACGPGIYTRPIARGMSHGRVVGLDLSRPMLRTAQRLARADQVQNVRFVCGNALALPIRTQVADAVNCCGALHLFPDVARALREMHRVMRAGGRLTLAVFARGEGKLSFVANRVRRRLVGIHAFTPSELEATLRQTGFDDVRFLHRGRIWQVLTARRER